MTNENEICEICGMELEYVRGYANGLSCPNASLHENEEMEDVEKNKHDPFEGHEARAVDFSLALEMKLLEQKLRQRR